MTRQSDRVLVSGLPSRWREAEVTNLEHEPRQAVALCREAQGRLSARVRSVDETTMRSPSLLPGWSVAHVLTHLARNADAHARRLRGALDGKDVPKYEGGEEQRTAEIETGHRRPAAEILSDLAESQARLEALFDEWESASWPNSHFRGGHGYGVAACPAHRLREVEMHHVDLGLGYLPADWPEEYMTWDLQVLLATVPERLDPAAARDLMAWLAGRAPLDPDIAIAPW